MTAEFELIEKIKKWIPRDLQCGIGIGDDAGILSVRPGEQWVVSSDALVEGTDFYLFSQKTKAGYVSPQAAGRKALAVNLSDLAAMGAKPKACVISLGLPPGISLAWVRNFYEGIVRLAREYTVVCAGGDISRAEQFFVSITVLGTVKQGSAILRSGAHEGDWIGVTGALGGSLQKKHYAFKPRIEESEYLSRHFKINSMIDVSDGLIQDLKHILTASKVGADLDVCEIPISGEAVQAAKSDPLRALGSACSDGEDFELLFTVSDKVKETLQRQWNRKFKNLPLSWIGRTTRRAGKVRWFCGGREWSGLKFKKTGYQHFF